MNQLIKRIVVHPVGAFALFDAAVRFAALASAHPGLGWRPWLVAGSPGFLVCVVSDVLLAIALWNLTWNAPDHRLPIERKAEA